VCIFIYYVAVVYVVAYTVPLSQLCSWTNGLL